MKEKLCILAPYAPIIMFALVLIFAAVSEGFSPGTGGFVPGTGGFMPGTG